MGSLSGYGEEYERPLTIPQAKRALVLAGVASSFEDARLKLPRMGHEVRVASHTAGEWPNARSELTLQNICGRYVLACVSWPTEHWSTVFGSQFGLNSDLKPMHEEVMS